MSLVLQGIAAAPGVALAAPWVYRPPEGGQDRISLEEAAPAAAREVTALAERLRRGGRAEEAGILDAQALMAEDPELLAAARRRIAAGESAAEAILAAGDEQAQVLAALDDDILAARAADVRDVAGRIARLVRGQRIPDLSEPSIAVAVDLPPSVTAELDPQLLLGIGLEAGSRTAHAAILARALGIPAVVSVPGLVAAASGARLLGIDGGTGEVTLDPATADRARLAEAMAARRAEAEADIALRGAPLATRDGHRVMLGANIGRPEEAGAAVDAGAEGVGLFRTEFMFMGRSSAPSIDEQAAAYAAALQPFGERPVVIRLLDIGGDKRLPYLEQPPEDNPFMGMRALRLAAANRALLVSQVRAILRAAERVGTRAWIMAPMVADLEDVMLFRGLLAEAGAPPPGSPLAPKAGIMVEVPAAAVVADQLARAVDFFSVGTNDLTQYLLAADRTNPALAGRQDPMHPAVLRSIRAVVSAGRGAGIPVAVCGEMAGDAVGAVALAGLGVDELSMGVGSFGPVKRALAALTLAEAAAAVAAAATASSAAASRVEVEGALHGAAGLPAGRSISGNGD